MSVPQAISVAGVKLSIEGAPVPEALHPWRADARGAELVVRVRTGRPLVPPGTSSAYGSGFREFGAGHDRLIVVPWNGATHLVTRDPGGGVLRSARFEPDAARADVTVASDRPGAALDRGLLEWLVSTRLARRGGFVLNGCAAVRDGRAMVFAGGPGSGRSTIARLLAGDPAIRVLTDDRIAIYETPAAGFVATAWPWPEAGAFRRRGTGVLGAIHRIRRAPALIAEPLPGEAALAAFLGIAEPPTGDPAAERRVRETIARCTERVPTIRLGCPADGRLLRYVGGTRAASSAATVPGLGASVR